MTGYYINNIYLKNANKAAIFRSVKYNNNNKMGNCICGISLQYKSHYGTFSGQDNWIYTLSKTEEPKKNHQ